MPVLEPGKLQLRAVVVHLVAPHQTSDHFDSRLGSRQGRWFLAEVAQSRIAPTDPTDCSALEGVVERGEERRQHGPIARARVGDHRADDHPLGLGQHQRIDDERLLPQDMRIEGPAIGEPHFLGQLG